MKVSSYLLIVYLAIPQSTSFSPSPHNHVSIQHAPSCLYQTDPSRKRDKVRTLIQTTASKAVSLSKSAKTVLSGPIANVIKDVSLETGGMASEKLIEVLNRIEGTLDRVEGEVGLLRGELKGVRDVLVSNLSLEAVVDDGSVDSGVHEDSDEVQNTLGEGALVETNAASTETSDTSTNLDLTTIDLSTLKYEDIDYTLTDMAPPFINEDECLVPGEPLVRVEKAPQNSRRIFAGIDIPVSVEEVWKLLTNYENLQKVVPNLVVNEVLQLYSGTNDPEPIASIQSELSDAEQCREIANRMKGAVLKQVGGAKVVGINFSARTTLEVREWPDGMPDFAHYEDEVYQGKSRSDRAKESSNRELTRYVFPRPFALSSLPHKDISMQSIENDDGEFRMYQGVWRMQPLPGCSPPGESAMRLTYAVEVSPRPYLPVALVERRIAADLCNNLKAIREHLAGSL